MAWAKIVGVIVALGGAACAVDLDERIAGHALVSDVTVRVMTLDGVAVGGAVTLYAPGIAKHSIKLSRAVDENRMDDAWSDWATRGDPRTVALELGARETVIAQGAIITAQARERSGVEKIEICYEKLERVVR